MQMLKSKLRTAVSIFSTYKNWWKWFFFYFFKKHARGETVLLRTRNPRASFLIKNDGEGWMMADEVWRVKVYTKYRGIRRGDYVVDIGANVGLFSIFAALSEKDVLVYAYEPMEEAFKIFKANVQINNLESKVFLFKKGVGQARRRAMLYKSEGKFGSASIFKENLVVFDHRSKKEIFIPEDKIKSEIVEIIDANSIWKNNGHFNFVKMDCEGAEYEILESLGNSVRRIEHFAIEYHKGYQWLKDFFLKKGFRVDEICPSANPRFGIIYATNKNFRQ